MSRSDQGDALRARATRASHQAPSGLGHSAGIPIAGHTPGEWRHGDTHVFALDETGTINRFYASIQTGFINRDTMEHTSVAERIANARLVAASPDNYARNVATTQYLDGLLAEDWLPETAKAEIAVLIQFNRAAINKATQP